jgi:hypothetical protein
MTQKSDISKPSQRKLTRVLEQMDSWKSHNTRLILSIHSPLFHLTLRGRIVGRLERLFLFDTYGETCRIAVIPEQYDRVLCNQKAPASVNFETAEMPGGLRITEDEAEPMFEEMHTDWALSKMCAEGAASNVGDQDRTEHSDNTLRSEFVGR